MTGIVPTKTKVAAKRAFIRTTAQGYAGAVPAGGFSAAVIVSTVEHPNPLLLAATVVSWLTAPLLAGAAAYADILSKGIPADYVDGA